MVKVAVMLKRKPGMGLQEFHRYWRTCTGRWCWACRN